MPGKQKRAQSPKWISGHFVAIALLLLHAAMAISGVLRKSTTSDEVAHLVAGYSYWIYNDYRLNPENGNLPQRWMALPLLLGNYRFPSLNQRDWENSDVWKVGHQFFYRMNNAFRMTTWRRAG
jgi:hypothetical protein